MSLSRESEACLVIMLCRKPLNRTTAFGGNGERKQRIIKHQRFHCMKCVYQGNADLVVSANILTRGRSGEFAEKRQSSIPELILFEGLSEEGDFEENAAINVFRSGHTLQPAKRVMHRYRQWLEPKPKSGVRTKPQ